jgi:hypothetical protein
MLVIILVGVVGILIFAEMLRRKYHKIAEEKILCEIWTKGGTVYEKPYPRNGTEVIVPKSVGEGTNRYIIDEKATYDAKYPANMPSFMQATIRKASYMEGNPEPIVNRIKEPIATTALLGNLKDERFTQFAVAVSQDMERLERELLKARTSAKIPMLLYVIVAIGVLLSGAGAYMAYQALQAVETGLGI